MRCMYVQESIEHEQMLKVYGGTRILGTEVVVEHKCKHSCASVGWYSACFIYALLFATIMQYVLVLDTLMWKLIVTLYFEYNFSFKLFKQ